MRIASLFPAATEMLFLIGAGEQVCAVSHECDFPPATAGLPKGTRTRVNSNASAEEIDRQVNRLLAAAEPLYEINLEVLRAEKPDLLLTQSQCSICAVPYTSVAEAIRNEPALAHVELFDLDPQSPAEMLDNLLVLGERLGLTTPARAVNAELQGRVSAITSRTLAIPPNHRPRTLLLEWTAPLMVAGNWMPELIDSAGGIPGISIAGEPSRATLWEDIRCFNPEVLLVAPCGFDAERSREELRLLARLPNWETLAAVRNSRVHPVDGAALFNRPGPRIVDSLELLASLIHPGLFPTSA